MRCGATTRSSRSASMMTRVRSICLWRVLRTVPLLTLLDRPLCVICIQGATDSVIMSSTSEVAETSPLARLDLPPLLGVADGARWPVATSIGEVAYAPVPSIASTKDRKGSFLNLATILAGNGEIMLQNSPRASIKQTSGGIGSKTLSGASGVPTAAEPSTQAESMLETNHSMTVTSLDATLLKSVFSGDNKTKNETQMKGKDYQGSSANLHIAMSRIWSTPTMQQASLYASIFAVMLLVFECVHKRFSQVDFEAPFAPLDDIRREQASGPGFCATAFEAVGIWARHARSAPYRTSFFVVTLVCLMLFEQYTNMRLVLWSNDFWNDIQQWGAGAHPDKVPAFNALLCQFMFFAMMSVCAGVYSSYINGMFTIDVRTGLTDFYTSHWLTDGAYYRLELMRNVGDGIDNPDQRIQEDIDSFVSNSLGLTTSMVRSVLQFFVFVRVVWDASPPDAFGVEGLHVAGWLLWAILLWSSVVVAFTMYVAWPLRALTAVSQRAEADFRYELTTVRNYAEPIALSQSEAVHDQLFADRFDVVRRCIWETMFVNKRYGIVLSFFDQAQVIFVLLILGNSFLKGRLTLGTLMSTDRSVGLITGSLMWFPESYGDILAWQATTSRLLVMERQIKRMQASTAGGLTVKTKSHACGLIAEDLAVWVPQPKEIDEAQEGDSLAPPVRTIFNKLDFTLPPGSRALLAGPSGAGKTSLIRSLSGIWPYAEGTVTIPAGENGAMYFSTDTYIPKKHIHAALSYPLDESSFSDDARLKALNLVQLGHLLSREYDGSHDWNQSLSHGEKARISLARLALHKPRLAVLDEPLAHLPESTRAPLLSAAVAELPDDASLLVISHEVNPDIVKLFNVRYEVDISDKILIKR